MAGRNNWTREQTMMAFALYRILPSGKWDKRNPTVQRLADHIRRSPSAVALKLGNLASLDENRTTKGLTNCSRLDREIWEVRVVPEKLRTLDHGRPWSDDQFASTRLSSNRDMSR